MRSSVGHSEADPRRHSGEQEASATHEKHPPRAAADREPEIQFAPPCDRSSRPSGQSHPVVIGCFGGSAYQANRLRFDPRLRSVALWDRRYGWQARNRKVRRIPVVLDGICDRWGDARRCGGNHSLERNAVSQSYLS